MVGYWIEKIQIERESGAGIYVTKIRASLLISGVKC